MINREEEKEGFSEDENEEEEEQVQRLDKEDRVIDIAWIANHDFALDYWHREIDRLTSGLSFSQEWFDASMIMIQTKNKSKEDCY